MYCHNMLPHVGTSLVHLAGETTDYDVSVTSQPFLPVNCCLLLCAFSPAPLVLSQPHFLFFLVTIKFTVLCIVLHSAHTRFRI